jgi:hypothetical protein
LKAGKTVLKIHSPSNKNNHSFISILITHGIRHFYIHHLVSPVNRLYQDEICAKICAIWASKISPYLKETPPLNNA